MDPFQPQQPDEGYSEDPLSAPAASTFTLKSANDAESAALLLARYGNELTPHLARHMSTLPLASKIHLTEALLDSLPTSIIAQIVQKLNPRLYIDFIQYLPVEICLKILGYLDPVSLLSVAMACRTWYGLALDRTLWERLYHLEGWKAHTDEMKACEEKVNRDKPVPFEGGHVYKKRAISASQRTGSDLDQMVLDNDRSFGAAPVSAPVQQPASSIFGQPTAVPDNNAMAAWQTGATSDAKKKGKERAMSPSPPATPAIAVPPMAQSDGVPKSSLWMWDPISRRYRISWKYLYSLRRRLETNWELGKFTNFQFPHPDYPHEAHKECIYTLQFNSEYLVSGSRDRSIRIWNMSTRRLVQPPLTGHRGSVLCLQFDSDPEEDLIVSGSSDSNVILWRFSTGEIIQRLSRAHREPVLNVKFDKHILVTCSKDKTIKIFNRRELKAGDLGYGDVMVDPVPIHLKDYGYTGLEQLPVKPPYTLIGSLEGHSAAVNAVQIYGREVVSASGDRNVKIWDWPNQTCVRTFVGHNKGIACVQYDGRRIVSGSSDNEVKVFDRQSGVEVASLRSHSNLVRTVQAGFGDLPYSTIEDEKEAARVDKRYFEAVQNGTLPQTPQHRRRGTTNPNPGSWRPEDIMFTGAKLPPGGGGGKYGRIVSGSYDTTIIIWRRDKEGIWKAQHHLKQEEAAAAAAAAANNANRTVHIPPRSHRHAAAPAATPAAFAADALLSSHTSVQQLHAAAASGPTGSMQLDVPDHRGGPTNPQQLALRTFVDELVEQGVNTLQQALATYPALLSMQGVLQAAIDRHPSPYIRSQLRQAVSTALVRSQIAQARGPPRAPNAAAAVPVSGASSGLGFGQTADAAAAAAVSTGFANPPGSSSTTTPHDAAAASAVHAQEQPAPPPTTAPAPAHIATVAPTATENQHPPASAAAAAAAAVTGAPPPAVAGGAARAAAHHPHINDPETANPARVFKLQFDARRIVCCSQTTVIVGWDFCNGDAELEEAVKFFGTVD